MRKILLPLLFLVSLGCDYSAGLVPVEDSIETDRIIRAAEQMWREQFPCFPQPVYESNDERRNGFIGVVGDCTETSIGIVYQDGFPPNAGVFTP